MGRKEVHNAIVTRNTDPDAGTALRGGVFFEAKSIFDGEYPIPALPMFQFASAKGAGFFHVPKVGDEIEVEIDVDDVTLPEPRWRCMIYSDAADIDPIFKNHYPFTMGWKTNSGHYFLFDDFEGEEMIKLFHKIGTYLEVNKEGSWLEHIVKDKIINIVKNLTVTVGGDETSTVTGKSEKTVTGLFTVTAEGKITLNTQAAMDLLADAALKVAGKGGTTVGDSSANTTVEGTQLEVNAPTTIFNSSTVQAGGATPVARLGDQCIGTGNLGAPVVSTIIQGSAVLGAG